MTVRKWLNATYLIVFGALLALYLFFDNGQPWTWFALVGFTLPASFFAILLILPIGILLDVSSTWGGKTIFALVWVTLTCVQLRLFNRWAMNFRQERNKRSSSATRKRQR